jgi:lycopene cyclase domain-containing protein
MTYFGFLLYYVVIPIIILAVITIWDEFRGMETPYFQRKQVFRIIGLHVLLAVVYTTPWDNYLVATGVWKYNPNLVSGIVIGWVPLEEYLFFVLETILSGLWWLFLVRRGAGKHANSSDRIPDAGGNSTLRIAASIGLALVWVVFTALFFSGWKPLTYLSITLFWALPAILPQFLFGADILWHYRKLLFWAIIPVGLYLSLVDIIALKASTWSISPQQTTGILFAGILPLEEVVFFLITNILIAFGMTLMLSEKSHQRLIAWRLRKFKGLP